MERNAGALSTLSVAGVSITASRSGAATPPGSSTSCSVLWWSHGRSYDKRVAVAQEYGVHGPAVWRIGSADTLR